MAAVIVALPACSQGEKQLFIISPLLPSIASRHAKLATPHEDSDATIIERNKDRDWNSRYSV
jgi:hypothetical protein